jgi:hypothetical protein
MGKLTNCAVQNQTHAVKQAQLEPLPRRKRDNLRGIVILGVYIALVAVDGAPPIRLVAAVAERRSWKVVHGSAGLWGAILQGS